MDVLLATLPAPGHVLPTTVLARRLVHRGHRVRWYTHEGQAAAVEAAGATLVPMTVVESLALTGESLGREWVPRLLRNWATYLMALAPAMLTELRAVVADDMPDLVVADPTILAARTLWEEGGPLYVMLGILPLMYGDPAIPMILQATIPSFEYPRPELSSNLRFCGPLLPPARSDDASAPWWPDLDPAKPIVHVTQGTLATNVRDLVLPTLEAFRHDPSVQVVAQVRDPSALATDAVPPNAHVLPWLDRTRWFPAIHCLVTNGGYSGVSTALAAGVPIVVAGQTEDKPEVGARVQYAGNGVSIGSGRPLPQQIYRAVAEVLTVPRYRERAHELAGRCAQVDSPALATLLLEDLWQRQTGEPALAAEA